MDQMIMFHVDLVGEDLARMDQEDLEMKMITKMDATGRVRKMMIPIEQADVDPTVMVPMDFPGMDLMTVDEMMVVKDMVQEVETTHLIMTGWVDMDQVEMGMILTLTERDHLDKEERSLMMAIHLMVQEKIEEDQIGMEGLLMTILMDLQEMEMTDLAQIVKTLMEVKVILKTNMEAARTAMKVRRVQKIENLHMGQVVLTPIQANQIKRDLYLE